MNNNFEFTFLGTSAADFSLLRTTNCHDRFDKNARRASCILLNDSFLIDCGMHVLDSLRIAKKDISKISDVFITHFHADHFIQNHVEAIAEGKTTPLRLWCREDAQLPEIKNVEVIKMNEGESYHLAHAINVKAVYANHEESSFPQHYIFELNGKKVMYATDGAWISNRAFLCLRKAKLDVLVIDATCGDYMNDYRLAEHNSLPMLRMMMPFLKAAEIIHNETKIYLTHLAPSLHKPHDETQALVKDDGFIVAYDGMTFSV
ncbi:MAG: MBL fold metallo-hydrolase [Clostridia bacterium]|nr:MBL fold metallo-hydrolase [Clostridia bacterium]